MCAIIRNNENFLIYGINYTLTAAHTYVGTIGVKPAVISLALQCRLEALVLNLLSQQAWLSWLEEHQGDEMWNSHSGHVALSPLGSHRDG